MNAMPSKDLERALVQGLRELRMPGIRNSFPEMAALARQESLSFERFLLALVEQEQQSRTNHRNQRFLRASDLPREKTLDQFDRTRLPAPINHQLSTLLEGGFLDRNENVLALGPPGTGKTHLLCALGNELVHQGRRVRFYHCRALVDALMQAKRDQCLSQLMKQLLRFEALIVDGLGYAKHSPEEVDVLFQLLAERYERGSVLVSSHLAFSEWEQIFQNAMTTTAVIDRLVHHSVILELNLPSYRLEVAHQRQNAEQSRTKAKDV